MTRLIALFIALFAASQAAALQAWVNAPEDGFLNLRTGPSTSYEVVREMPHGSRVTVLEDGNWFRVRDAYGNTGFAAARYLSATEPRPRRTGDDDIASRRDHSLYSGEIDRGGSGYRNRDGSAYRNRDGSAYRDRDDTRYRNDDTRYRNNDRRHADVPLDQLPQLYINAPQAGALNLRDGPGTNFPVIDTMTQGSSVRVLDDSQTWYLIRHEDGRTGYAHSSYLSQTRQPLAPRSEPQPRREPQRHNGSIVVEAEDLPRILANCAFVRIDRLDSCIVNTMRR
ncbi:MAG: SH3 domain-containing protein [Sagittula sp.]|uniref:SH3 domain-containing protein n=1 Tax=Sagittula sp. TaxID=2038081 RepID=UPI004059E933